MLYDILLVSFLTAYISFGPERDFIFITIIKYIRGLFSPNKLRKLFIIAQVSIMIFLKLFNQ